MSISDISPIGLPSSLKYDQLPSISDSVTNYAVSVAPSGLTVVGPVTTGDVPAFVQNGSGFINAPFTSQNIDFQLPGAGSNDSVFLDCRETYLTGGSGTLMHLIGSA